MRTQPCREAMEKVAELCGISDETIKKTEPITQLCNEKGNTALKRCATQAILPITQIKNPALKREVISEAVKILRERGDDGEFIKERLTKADIVAIIVKHSPKSKKPIVTEELPRFRLNKSQHTVLKRMVSLKIVPDEREAFVLLFKWAAERIAKKK